MLRSSGLLIATSCVALLSTTRIVEAQVLTQTLQHGGSVAQIVPHSGPGLALPPTSAPTSASTGQTLAAAPSWQPMSVPPNLFIRAISMATPLIGYACGELGVVLKTIDGGATWQYVQNLGFPYYWYGCRAINANDVIFSGFQNQSGDGVVEWTHNGATSFAPIVALPAPGAAPRWLDRVVFTDAQHGFVEASWAGGVQRTSTGGLGAADWTYTQVSSGWFQGTFTYLADGRAWLAGIDEAFTPNSGTGWSVSGGTNAIFDGAISIHQQGVGFSGGGEISPAVAGWVYRTVNGGHTWTNAPVLSTPFPIRALLAYTPQRAWAVGGNYYSNVGGIYGTSDGGVTWTLEQSTGNEMNDVDWVRTDADHVNVFVAGYLSQIWRATIVSPTATALVATSYGFCDAQSAPCGNAYDSAGCRSGIGVGGVLDANGSSSVAADDLVLDAFQLPLHKSALFFVGPAVQQIVLGNGLNCVAPGASGVHRFPIQDTGTTGTLAQGPGIVAFAQAHFPAASWITPGSTWNFQGYYRDPIGPCGATMNLTNAMRVTFGP